MNDTASQAGLQACVEFTDGCSEQLAETSRPLSGPRGRMSISEVIRSVCRLNVTRAEKCGWAVSRNCVDVLT